LFEFDYDLTFMVFFLNAGERIYGRYGGRDGRGPDTRMSLAGLHHAMGAALDTHGREAELAPPELVPAPHEATSYTYRYRVAAALLAAARADRVATTTHIRLGREGLRAFGAVSDDPMFLCDFAIAAHRVGDVVLAAELAAEARVVGGPSQDLLKLRAKTRNLFIASP